MVEQRIKETLVSLLRDRAESDPDRIVYSFLDDRTDDVRDISFGELDAKAKGIAAKLRESCKEGDRALVVLPPGPGFLFAFWGCLYAGVIAVPTPEPFAKRDLDRLTGIIASAEPACVVASGPLREAGAGMGLVLPGFAPEDADEAEGAAWTAPRVDGNSIAFLQYTSGSTGDPKGVIVSHRNVLANEEMIRRAFGHDASSTVVGWLPHFHDMGLIGNILQPLYVGSRAILMSPQAFMRDPLRWLKTIAKYRASTSGGPNFAYELCVRRHDRLRQPLELDLSSWQVAFVGAEPVRAATVRSFAKVFSAYGFDERAIFPCYGLAEATLFVTGGEKKSGLKVLDTGRAEGSGTVFVGCGTAATGLDVRIVEPRSGVECPVGTEGEVLVSGPSVSRGYWGRPLETSAAFDRRIAGRESAYLGTGDLGVRRGDEFYITGRIRDLIILHGQNYYPQDIEAAAESVASGIRPGHSASFSFPMAGEERVVLVCEIGDIEITADELCNKIRGAVARAQGVAIDVIVLIEARTLPKTTSGKVERQATRRDFLEGRLRARAASHQLAGEGPWSSALAEVRVSAEG